MPAEKPRLSEAIDDFLRFRKAEGKSPNTMRNDRIVLRRLLLTSGDLFLAGIGDRQINVYLATAAESRSGASLAVDYSVLSQFFAWAVRNRLVGRFANPMEGRKPPKPMPKERQRVHMKDFPRLLDAAGAYHPRDRMAVALGLYLFLRGSEAATLRIGDVRLEDGEVLVRVWKTKQIDPMPISAELDREIRSWLTYYSIQCGPLDPSWFLIPHLRRPKPSRDPDTKAFISLNSPARLVPESKITRIQEVAQRALSEIGFRLREETGESRREGMHTLRRSGARARFDTLERVGYDGAIRHVQTLLHHSTMAMTELYLGLSLDRVKRNELVKGQPMFDQGDNVIVLDPGKRGEAVGG